nr:MAG TPA: hypothetical protein [Bacteriophage sp.]
MGYSTGYRKGKSRPNPLFKRLCLVEAGGIELPVFHLPRRRSPLEFPFPWGFLPPCMAGFPSPNWQVKPQSGL